MGRGQPYLYDPKRSSQNSVPEVFNPRAVTMASREPPSPRKKQTGPLIDFNKHPDSYLILPYGKTEGKVNPKIALYIKIARWVQFVFRVPTVLGAIGALLCGIFIRGAQDTEGYLVRIPPGVDIVHCLYALYHLLRPAKARPAGSSASYHFYALIMDAGFIPFYVFTVLLARRNYDAKPGSDGRWRTFFPTDEDTNKVLLTTWLNGIAVAGLHVLSLIMDLYLLLVFRKISHLPPDMNPLEDNLTSRRKTKHKHKNSSISAITPLTAEDKRFSAQSGTTTIGNRNSQTAPLITEKEIPSPGMKQMSFLHTRTNSDMSYSPHTPETARHSRQSLYGQNASARQSRSDLNHRDDLLRRDDPEDNQTLAQRKAVLAQKAIKRSSRPQSFVSSSKEFYTPPTTAEKQDMTGGDISLQQSLQSDNWFVHDEQEDYNEAPQAPAQAPVQSKRSMFSRQTQGYNTVASDEMSDDDLDAPMVPQPLRMNPPTPPPSQLPSTPDKQTAPPSALQRTYTTTSISSEATFSRSPTRASTPKTRYYGDLRAATQGIRSGQSPSNSPTTSPKKRSLRENGLPSSVKAYTVNTPPPASNKPFMSNSPISLDKKSYASVRRTGEMGYTPVHNQSPRVLSRSGVDYDGASAYDDAADLGASGGRRRDVSGKIAEEGRGGAANMGSRWGFGKANELTYRKVSGVA
ncbi:hypothetical protein BU24DRAFT_444392 [Aaosphaeria arxii CBS 175.79]|uniref:Uncharacterized protein n=1 Tax=Aaosphaeria arxii CBS 175.79 TaxID=1450172 RepID=A0A6A5XBT6_9PLEO|nr:uncharacterized protein BU24DRAFT_444392 [Aaosphaeria arxii CBS 175.79]KAF2010428.1 hypothetical protein BU24DRAFT_444392 [Aaosphaeria arxii CBS 175.79]